jgi:signal transduction histidine kinase
MVLTLQNSEFSQTLSALSDLLSPAVIGFCVCEELNNFIDDLDGGTLLWVPADAPDLLSPKVLADAPRTNIPKDGHVPLDFCCSEITGSTIPGKYTLPLYATSGICLAHITIEDRLTPVPILTWNVARHLFQSLTNELCQRVNSWHTKQQQVLRDTILDHLQAYVFLKDDKNHILYANNYAANEINKTKDELVGGACEDLWPTMAAKYYEDDLEVFTNQAPKLGIMERYLGVDHRGRWAITDKIPIFSRDGVARRLLALAVDCTDLLDATLELKKKTDSLEAAHLELSQLAFVASHDLQEPLRLISTYSELFRIEHEGRLDEKSAQWLEFLGQNSSRVRSLIKDLFIYLESRTLPLRLDSIRLAELTKSLLPTVPGITNATITVEIPEELRVVADTRQLARLLYCLVDNAIKFSRPGRHTALTISAQKIAPGTSISITDNGMGIEEEFYERIFTVFQKVHVTPETSGTGTGLALCRRILERHGGRLTLDSQVDVGSTFTAYFPDQIAASSENLNDMPEWVETFLQTLRREEQRMIEIGARYSSFEASKR